MTRLVLPVLLLILLQLVCSYYIKPIDTRTLVSRCSCGFIVPEAQCTSVFHSPEMDCGLMTVFYAATSHPDCSKVYITCTKQGLSWQSVGIVGKVEDDLSEFNNWSLLSQRKVAVNHLTLTCNNGSWIETDLEGKRFSFPLQIQCASSNVADALDYYATDL